MKRILKYFIFIILLLPLNVKAYGIENYFVNATLKDNGDLLVEEYFYLNGDYNGFERIINYNNEKAYPFDPNMDFYGGSTLHNGSGIILHEIRALDIETDFDFTNINGDKFHEVSSADRGDYGVYTIDSTMNGASYKVYLPDYKNKAFYLKYTLVNMAIYHNDVGELGFNIVGDKLSESVNNFKAYVNFPSNKGKLLGWAHGPLKGKINILNNQKLEVTINDLYSYTSIDVRATFDKDIISNSKKRSNVSALDKILKYEESKANQANYERQNEEKLRQIEAEESLNYLEEHLDRYNYNRATTKVLNVSNLEKRKTYLQRLNDLKKLLDVKEEKEAYESVEWAEHYISYYEYNNALEKVKVLDNEKIKTELNNRLKTVKEKIIEKEKKLEKRNYILGGILYLVVFIIAIYIYYKYDKEFKSEFNQTYLRDFPSDFSPTTVAYLFKRKITNDSLSATILDLIRKKAIRYESNGDKNYILYNESSNISNLSSTEKRLIDLIFDDRDKVDLKTLKKYAEKHYSSFSSNWTSFKKAAENEAKSEELFIDNSNKKNLESKNKINKILILSIFILFFFPPITIHITIILWIYAFYLYFKEKREISKLFCFFMLLILSFISIIFSIYIGVTQHFVNKSVAFILFIPLITLIIMIYMFKTVKKTQKGINEYSKWKAFKNFLKDFGSLDSKDLPDIVLWEKYLVYATTLGVAKKLSKVMKIKAEELNISDSMQELPDISNIYYMNRIITRSVRSSINSANQAYRVANSSSSGSSWSSGSGSGGGFSSGGGSFGGGGGGGRF